MFGFLKKGLDKTLAAIRSSKPADKKISKEILEEILLEADIAYEIVEEILYYLPPKQYKIFLHQSVISNKKILFKISYY